MSTARIAAAAMLSAIGGCSTKPASHGTELTVHCSADGRLTGLVINDHRMDIAPGESDDAFLGRALASLDVDEPIRLRGGTETPWRCIGKTIYTLQLDGTRKIDFVANGASGKGE